MNPPQAYPSPNVFSAALAWLQGAALGPLATLVAVIAVAFIGYMLLSGRRNIRRAGQVLLGCFILFGAPTIANGILHGLTTDESQPPATASLPPPPEVPIPQNGTNPGAFDPYAGAAVPMNH